MITGEQLFNKRHGHNLYQYSAPWDKGKKKMKHDKDRAMWVDKKKNDLWLDILFDDNVKP